VKVSEAVATLAASVFLLAGCVKHGPVLERAVGDGRWSVGEQIANGTWRAANTGPHTDAVQCEWTVSKKSNQGAVTLRSHDTDNKVQEVFLADGDVFDTHNCGLWAWVSTDNLT
jgi:hypothetical protein